MAADPRPPGLSPQHKALLLVVVLVAGGLRWHNAVLENFVKPDEAVYVSAAKLFSEGKSPYEERIFFYTPFFAWVSSNLSEQFGTLGYLRILRAFNLLGICLATWFAVLITAWRWWPALIASVGWLWFSPVVALPIHIGNATGLSAALTLASLWVWMRQPVAAGMALGLGQALKPIAPLAPFCFLALGRGTRSGSALQTAIASLVTVGLLLLVDVRSLPGIFGNAIDSGANPYNFSLQRVLVHFGVPVQPIWIVAVVGAAGLAWIASRKLSKLEFLVAAITLNLFAAPILWAHSLLPFLPVLLLAGERTVRSLRGAGSRLHTAFPHIVAGLAIASTLLSASIGGLNAEPAWVQGIVLTVPLLSLPYLGIYVLAGLRGRPGRVQR